MNGSATKSPSLGHLLTDEGIKPHPRHLTAVKGWEPPLKTRKQVQSFLGLAGFLRVFIENYSVIASPLTDLTKPGPFQWNEQATEAMLRLKEAVSTAPAVQPWDPSAPTRVVTDASDVGIGAALMQNHGTHWHVVEYFSKKLNDTERRYCATDKEFLAIIEAVTKHWRHFLLDRHFEIWTDHNPLTGSVKIDSRHQDARRTRWLERLQCFSFTLKYIKGKQNGLADAMSRCPDFCKVAATLSEDFEAAVGELHHRFHWGTRKIARTLKGRVFPRQWRKIVATAQATCTECKGKRGQSQPFSHDA